MFSIWLTLILKSFISFIFIICEWFLKWPCFIVNPAERDTVLKSTSALSWYTNMANISISYSLCFKYYLWANSSTLKTMIKLKEGKEINQKVNTSVSIEKFLKPKRKFKNLWIFMTLYQWPMILGIHHKSP